MTLTHSKTTQEEKQTAYSSEKKIAHGKEILATCKDFKQNLLNLTFDFHPVYSVVPSKSFANFEVQATFWHFLEISKDKRQSKAKRNGSRALLAAVTEVWEPKTSIVEKKKKTSLGVKYMHILYFLSSCILEQEVFVFKILVKVHNNDKSFPFTIHDLDNNNIIIALL